MGGDETDILLSKRPRHRRAKRHPCLFGKETRQPREATAPNKLLQRGNLCEPGGQHLRNILEPVFMKENDLCAGRWYGLGEHFYVQFRVHCLHTAQTEIISLVCVSAPSCGQALGESRFTHRNQNELAGALSCCIP